MLASSRRLFSTSAQSSVTFQKHGKIGIVKFCDPAKLNPLTASMGDRFTELLNHEIDYSEVSALVLSGEGKAFSAGGDLNFLKDRSNDSPSRNAAIMRAFYQRFLGPIRQCPLPIVAAINGHAIGAGLAVALACDLRIAAKSARLGISFVNLGLHPGMGSTFYLPKLVGQQFAARMALTGETVTGEEAARMGMVLSAEDDDQVLGKALELAERIGSQGPLAVRSTVRTLRMAQDEGLERALWREADAQATCWNSTDLKEGVGSITSKQKPVFKNFENYKL